MDTSGPAQGQFEETGSRIILKNISNLTSTWSISNSVEGVSWMVWKVSIFPLELPLLRSLFRVKPNFPEILQNLVNPEVLKIGAY